DHSSGKARRSPLPLLWVSVLQEPLAVRCANLARFAASGISEKLSLPGAAPLRRVSGVRPRRDGMFFRHAGRRSAVVRVQTLVHQGSPCRNDTAADACPAPLPPRDWLKRSHPSRLRAEAPSACCE